MKGRAFIDRLRKEWPSSDILSREARALLADAVEIADEAARELIESESIDCGDWWDTHSEGFSEDDGAAQRAISYLDRRGLIERKEGEPHLVRFREE